MAIEIHSAVENFEGVGDFPQDQATWKSILSVTRWHEIV